jgi:5-methylcytosine-specific restriction endonuclease McrA
VIDPTTRALVIQRAGNVCEYCRLPQVGYEATFNVDHIIATQHQLDDSRDNLALSCPKCNRKKGPNLASIDPVTKTTVRLFNPRTDLWTTHFEWRGLLIAGLTPTESDGFTAGLEQSRPR